MAKRGIIEFTGEEELIEMLAKFPGAINKKIIISVFRKAAKPFLKQLKQNAPGSTKTAIGSKTGKSKEYPNIAFGFIGKKGKKYQTGRGSEIPAYMVAYFNNYGTLANRDKSHTFLNARRRKTANWRGGIVSQKFAEQAWETTEEQCKEISNEDMKKIVYNHIKKYVVK